MMRDHIIGEDYELWDIVTDGPLATTKKNAEGVDVPKTRAECTVEDLKKWEKNTKAKKWLVCGLGPDEYSRIQSCTTAKEIWDTLQVAYEGTPQESQNIVALKLDEVIGNLTAYELRRQIMKMDAPKKEKSLALRIAEGADLEEDEMAMIIRDFKKYLMKGKGSSRGTTFDKPKVPEKQTNEGCYKCGKTDHMIKNFPQWEIEWKKERAERRNRKKEQVQPKRNKGSTKAIVATWGETSDEDSEDEAGDEQALMTIKESDDEQEVSVFHLKDKIKFLSKERLSELLIDFIYESEIINNEKEDLSRECVILKAKCKNLESRANESDRKNAELKNHVLELDTSVSELRSENLKLKLRTGKEKADHIHLTVEKNLGKMKDELYRKDEQIKVLKEDLGKVQVKESSQIWYMYSGCLKYMTGSKNQFLSLEDLKGYGLKYNLISVSQLCDRGNLVAFTSIKFFVINLTTDKIVLQGKRVNNIYIVDLSTLSENELTCLIVLDNDPFMWHKRIGHAILNQLNKLVSKDLVIGRSNIKFKEDKVCEACAREKLR
ncbi:uncharacterized protein [Nicotiana sylvestris]|uniref:uncharacterized protein n=1 Tax=Nicotiana sylvestris TaxID=4096 RepID=UPI00388CAA60